MTRAAHPLVTLIIPTYNYAQMLPTALHSVLEQGLPELEVLVMDDASTDDTTEVMQAFAADPRVRYVRQPHNLGTVGNTNAGLGLARGRFIALLAADDKLMPGFFFECLRFKAMHPQAEVIYTEIFHFRDEHGEYVAREGPITGDYCGGRNEFAALLAHGCYMFFGALLVERAVYERFGLFDPAFGTSSDFEMLVRWAKHNVVFGHVAKPLAAFRTHDHQLSSPRKHAASGQVAHEYCAILAAHLDAVALSRVHGYEHAVMRHLSWKQSVVQTAGFLDEGHLAARISRLTEKLQGARAEFMVQTATIRQAVIILDSGDEAELERSLASVAPQLTSLDECIVVSNQESRLPDIAADLRFRWLRLDDAVAEGRRLNMAIRLANADVLHFLRAGSCFDSTHLATMQSAFAHPGCEIIVSTPSLVVNDDTVDAAYRALADLDMALLAPVFPLESFAVRRRSFDAYLAFADHINVVPEWEFFLRVRGREEIALAPHLRVHVDCAYLRDLNPASRHAFLPLVDALYKAYPLHDARVHPRGVYRAQMAYALEHWVRLVQSPAGLCELTRIVHGAVIGPLVVAGSDLSHG